jgi:Tat protein translocase TatB subunit
MSLTEILLILLVALLVLGPKHLPEVAYWLGKGMQQFNILRNRLQQEFNSQIKLAELKHNEAKASAAEQIKDVQEQAPKQDANSSEVQ